MTVLSIYIAGKLERCFDVRGDVAQIGMVMATFLAELERKGRVAVTLTRGNLVHIVKVSR